MGRWYEQAIANSRKNPKAQEFHNTTEDLFANMGGNDKTVVSAVFRAAA